MRKFVVLLVLLALAAAPAQAVISGYDPRYIDIDGNITPGDGNCNPAGSSCIDWQDKLEDGSLNMVPDGWGNSDSSILSPGSTLSSGSTLAKEDITRVWMSNNNQYLYIAEERRANNGNSAWHLFFTRIAPTHNLGEPVVYHLQNGDVEVQICFPKGNDPSDKSISVSRVMGVSGILDVPVVDVWSTGVLQAADSSVVAAFEVNTLPTTALAGARDSKGNETSTYDTACFAEAAISLELLGLNPCGSRAYASVVTRSSCSLTSDLKDLAEPVLYSFGGPVLDPIVGSVDCNGNGTFSVTLAGGAPPYTIQWYDNDEPIPGATGESADVSLIPGDHIISVVVTDSTGCADRQETEPVSVYPPVDVSSISYSLDCANRGCFSVTISGGVEPYTIQWYDNGTLLPDFTDRSFCTTMTPGTHNLKVVVTDSNGCSGLQQTGDFTVYPVLAVSPITKTIDCRRNVCCSVTVTGGVEPLTYQWSDNGSPISDATGSSFCKVLDPGTHSISLVVTDAAGCKQERATGEFTVYDDLTVSDIDKSLDCSTKGCFSVSISGGAPAYTIQWYDSGELLTDVTGESFCKEFDPGTHNVKVVVTDTRGCSTEKETGDFAINPVLVLSDLTQSVDCDNNACFSITVTGGEEPYTYEWYDNDIPVPEVITDSFCKVLTQGTHNVKVVITDNAGCKAQKETGDLTVYELLSVSPITRSVDCANRGCFSVTIAGGVEPYTIQWFDNGTILPDFTDRSFCTTMTPGTHNLKVVVTDSRECSMQKETGEFTVYDDLTVSDIDKSLDCSTKGCFSVSISGGAPAYTIQWYDSGELLTDVTGESFCKEFDPGTHNVKVVVTDARSCTAQTETQPFPVYRILDIELTAKDECSGSVVWAAAPRDGDGNYSYEWSVDSVKVAGAVLPTLEYALAADCVQHTVSVTVTDGRGCRATATKKITQTVSSLIE